MPSKEQFTTPEENQRRGHNEAIYERQQELLRSSDQELELADRLINSITGTLHLSLFGKQHMRQRIRKYGFVEVMDAIRESLTGYTWEEEEGGKSEKLANALKDLDKLLKIKKLKSSDPEEAKRRYLAGILRNRFNGAISWSSFGELVSRWRAASQPIEDLYEVAKTASSWWEFKRRVEELLGQMK